MLDLAQVDPLDELGYPGLHGVFAATTPGMTAEEIAMVSKFRHPKISYTTTSQLTAAGFPVIPTPGSNPLHASIVVPQRLTDAQAATLSAIFQQNIRLNPAYGRP